MGKEHSNDGICDSFIPKDHIKAKTEKDQTMSDITKHYSKEKGECNYSEEGRVGLLVSCYTVCLDDLLSRAREIVALVKGGEFISGRRN